MSSMTSIAMSCPPVAITNKFWPALRPASLTYLEALLHDFTGDADASTKHSAHSAGEPLYLHAPPSHLS